MIGAQEKGKLEKTDRDRTLSKESLTDVHSSNSERQGINTHKNMAASKDVLRNKAIESLSRFQHVRLRIVAE